MNDDPILTAIPENEATVMRILQPRDDIEYELLEQMQDIRTAMIKCIRMGDQFTGFGSKMGYYGLAAKSGRTYATLAMAFDHHRGKGMTEQEITVNYNYMNVADGGQAVVGMAPRQGGGRQKSEKQPQRIEYAPAQVMPGQDAQRQPVSMPRNGQW